MDLVTAYTDGSASVAGKNAGRAGFGTYFPDLKGKRRAFSKGFIGKTGQAETMALLYALKAVHAAYDTPVTLMVVSDSEYVVKTITEGRLSKWRKAGWINTSGVVKNKELWCEIYSLAFQQHITLKMKHIRSHKADKLKGDEFKAFIAENPHILGNMVADRLANYKQFL